MISSRWPALLLTGAALVSGPNLAQTSFSGGNFQGYVLADNDGVPGLDDLLMVGTYRDGSAFFTGSKTNVFNSAPWYEWSSFGTTPSTDQRLLRDPATGNQYLFVGNSKTTDIYNAFGVAPEGTGVYRVTLRLAGDGFVTFFDQTGRTAMLSEASDPSRTGVLVARSDAQPSHSYVVNGTPGVWNEYSFDVYLTSATDYRLYVTNYWSTRPDLTAGAGGDAGQDSASFLLDDVSIVKLSAQVQAPLTLGGP